MSNISKCDKQSSWLHRLVGLIRLLRSAPLAHREAERLARVMWRRAYREVAPDWQPLLHAGVVSELEELRTRYQRLATDHVALLSALPNDQDQTRRDRSNISNLTVKTMSDTKLQEVAELAPVGGSAWLPIENAPKDQTWILLTGGKVCDEWYGSPPPPAVVGKWELPSWEGARGAWMFCDWNGGLRSEYKDPTYWMPIAALPNDQDQTRRGDKLKP